MSGEDVTDMRSLENVRRELKKWEWSFKQANGGRKPGREDIKNDATISAKYKEYDLLARGGKQQSSPRKEEHEQVRRDDRQVLRERSANAITATPRKKAPEEKPLLLLEEAAAPVEEPTPACIRFALGPTPQKDGEILGLFDMLPSDTPSKGENVPIGPSDAVISATPSKSRAVPSSDPQLSKTPQSSAKRYYLETLGGTPLKRKREDDIFTPSTTRRQYATPAFLRRSWTLPSISEEGLSTAVAGQPFKKRGLCRSLSAIIQGLKKQEDERMDDEWDVMNEIEAEERGDIAGNRPNPPSVVVEDSQRTEMPLGPDRNAQSDVDSSEDDVAAVDANGKPRKPWKKKGLKRQTRRVIMRPTKHKPKREANQAPEESGESDTGNVAETQQPDVNGHDSPQGAGSACEQDGNPSQEKAVDQLSTNSKKSKTKDLQDVAKEDDTASKKPKKVNALAHTNFRKLKIKNKNSKANGRKFGRR